MAYEDKVVDVTVTLGTQPISRVGFETPLLLQCMTTLQNVHVLTAQQLS